MVSAQYMYIKRIVWKNIATIFFSIIKCTFLPIS